MNKKTILFIVNQLSGTVSTYNIPKCIEMFLDHDQFIHKIFYIDSTMDEEKYEELLGQAWDIIISVGGDGTLLDIGQRVLQHDVTLGIIPIGSGNGFATHVGYRARDIEGAFKAINQQSIEQIDVARLNDRYFFSNFGYGLDAKVARDFKIKKKRSFFVYSFLTFKRIVGIKPNRVRYQTRLSEDEVETYLFNVFNSNLFGYGVGMLPWASAKDGKLDIVYLEKTNFLMLIWASICILCKRPHWCSRIRFFETDKITIINDTKLEYQIDGDPQTAFENIEIEVIPKMLKLIVP